MKEEIFINLEQEFFNGNVLDIGFCNKGIVYNLFKKYDFNDEINYINGEQCKDEIEEDFYDNCILFFSLSNIMLSNNKEKLIQDIYKYLKEDGNLYIWDIDKPFTKGFNAKIKILLPNKEIKKINIIDFNILKNASKENTVELLKNKFDIIDLKSSQNIYYLRAKRKGRNNNESTVSRS